ncbi:MAG TPA: hypothetical protein VHS31_04395 [Tepidisphaeraceae bacterium]|jgi:hypothetical protein|nr:hypothetical protein [Tepidisphaeraceae bacterium]
MKTIFHFGSSILFLFFTLDVCAQSAQVNWLDSSAPDLSTGVSFGVPWAEGKLQKDTKLSLVDGKGQGVAVQSWALAYWPDGSLKWTGEAISAEAGLAGPLKIVAGEPAAAKSGVKVDQTNDAITIDTGAIVCRISKSGSALIDSISIGDKKIASNGKLVCTLEDRSEYETKRITREEDFASKIDSVTVEQSGPVRAVVKVTGKHQSTTTDRAWLPFVVRFYFFAGLDSIKVVHTFIFDGDQEKDFIKGLGIRFDVPMRQQFQNRHVRLAGETGMFAEPLQIISGRRLPSRDLYQQQVAGKQVPDAGQSQTRGNFAGMAVWDAYKLVQITPDGYTIEKRTNPKSTWVRSAGGTRALGTAFVGDTSGGLSISMKNFWQEAPTEIEIEKGSTDSAELTLWLWSPDSPAMDMRHYDVKGHGLEMAYEDWQPGFSYATGVARTNEITLRAFNEVPANEELLKLAKETGKTSRLVCSPEYFHSIPVFGIWSLPDRSNPAKVAIEDQLDKAITFYQGQIEQRRWYGFWDFGDVMHTYDAGRHEWRYDLGGFAWANTELEPNLWLWYSFLRSGRADIFRMAEAMTRQTQEVDVYHLGKFAGLGSRHNVVHWGDGAKELRISQALLKRPYYYLTTDERTGDLMNEVIDADEKLVDVDPMREIEQPTKYPTHARFGPDWLAACANWYTAWERTGDVKYRDRIITGMKCLAAMPHKLFSGPSYGYDPKTKMLYQIHNQVDVPTLAALMGGPELCFEMNPVINLPEWNDAWLNYCRYLQAPPEEQRPAIGGAVTNAHNPTFAKMTAYAAHALNDPKLAARAWDELLDRRAAGRFDSKRIDNADVPAPIDEIPFVSTNDTSQWSLNAIELLELVGKDIPNQAPSTQEGN